MTLNLIAFLRNFGCVTGCDKYLFTFLTFFNNNLNAFTKLQRAVQSNYRLVSLLTLAKLFLYTIGMINRTTASVHVLQRFAAT